MLSLVGVTNRRQGKLVNIGGGLSSSGLLWVANNDDDEFRFLQDLIVRVLYGLQSFMVLCSPAIAAGLVTSAVEELKLLLHDKLLHERGNTVSQIYNHQTTALNMYKGF